MRDKSVFSEGVEAIGWIIAIITVFIAFVFGLIGGFFYKRRNLKVFSGVALGAFTGAILSMVVIIVAVFLV